MRVGKSEVEIDELVKVDKHITDSLAVRWETWATLAAAGRLVNLNEVTKTWLG